MGSNAEWFKFYPGDWLTSREVRRMSPTQRGYYIQLLAESWENPLPSDPEELAWLAGAKDVIDYKTNGGEAVTAQFVESDGKLVHPKIEELRNEYMERSEVARNKANSRWKKVGNATAMPQQCHSITSAMPSENVSNAIKKEESKKEREQTPRESDEHVPDSDQKLAMIAMLHPKLSHLTERELPVNVLSGIIDAVAGERERQGITEADALKYLFDETRRVVLAASKTGQDRFLKSPADFWKPGIAQYRRPDSDFQVQGPPPQPKIKVSPPGTNSLANQVEALRRAEEAKKAPQTQTQ